PVPVSAGVAAGVDGAQPEHGLGAWQAPAGAGDAHPVGDQVAAGALDDAGGDRPAFGQGAGVVHVGLLGLQVGQGFADDLGVLAARFRRVSSASRVIRAITSGTRPCRMSSAWSVTQSSMAGSRGGWKHQAAFHRYSSTWMKSITTARVIPRAAAAAWIRPSW